MAIDSNNIVRVDLTAVFDACRTQSALRSEAMDRGESIDIVAIGPDRYHAIIDFALEATAKIADSANYIENTEQTGLDALTRQFNSQEGNELSATNESQKFPGEAMDPDLKPQMIFNIPELENVNVQKNTIVQQYIKEAMTHYILYKWYDMRGYFDFGSQEKDKYEEALRKVGFNSINNTKRKGAKRKPRMF